MDVLIEQLRTYPEVRTAPHHDGPFVEQHIMERIAAAGRERVLVA